MMNLLDVFYGRTLIARTYIHSFLLWFTPHTTRERLVSETSYQTLYEE